MPGMDGFAVCRQLKANPATAAIPIILITTRTDPGTETHGLGLGAVDCISKPLNPDVVRARVHAHLTLKYQADLLKKLVLLDGLSGVFNRRYFDQQLATEWARAARSGLSLSLVLLDVDHFAAYNARYGHQAGDDCLRLIAVTLKSVLRRPADVVARFAGEEFACLLPDTSHADALGLAQTMVQRVQQLRLPTRRRGQWGYFGQRRARNPRCAAQRGGRRICWPWPAPNCNTQNERGAVSCAAPAWNQRPCRCSTGGSRQDFLNENSL